MIIQLIRWVAEDLGLKSRFSFFFFKDFIYLSEKEGGAQVGWSREEGEAIGEPDMGLSPKTLGS